MLGWLPEAASTYARDIDEVFYFIYYLTAFVFLLVTVLMIWFVYKYRYREGEERRALYSHGNTTLEIIWTVVPAIVFIGIWVYSKSAWSTIKDPASAPQSEVQVRAVGKQFQWDFQYPGPDGQFDTPDDKTIQHELHVPAEKVVVVLLRGQDVIHSFFIPVFRLKQDVLPGREIRAWFKATKAGRWEIPCAELCGPGHSGMKGWITVYAATDYEDWVKKTWPAL
jgi:cytochrome c oxidase subunit II